MRKFLCAAAWACFYLMNDSEAQSFVTDYSVEGVLKYSQKQPDPGSAAGYKQKWDFKLFAENGGRWKMELHTKLADPVLPIESTQHLSYDGTNIYSVTHSPYIIETRPGSRPKLKPAVEDSGAGLIASGPYPIDHGGAAAILWFGFFGGQFLDGSTNRAPFPNLLLGQPRGNPIAWSCQLVYTLDGHKLIQEGAFYLDPGSLKNNSVEYPELNEPTDQVSLENMKQLFARCKTLKGDSLLRSKYVLDQAHESGDCRFPVRFHADLFGMDSGDMSMRVECEVTNVLQNRIAVEVKPKVNGEMAVLDTRFRMKGGTTWRGDIHYLLGSDGWIVETNSARVKNLLDQIPMRPLLSSTSLLDDGRARRVRGFRWFLGLSIVLPLLGLVLRYVSSASKRKTKL